jgi:acetyl esterase/lipase
LKQGFFMNLSFRVLFGLAFLASIASAAVAQEAKRKASYPPELPEAKAEVYKTVGDVKLSLYIFSPADHKPTDKRPAIVFFFGGGWTGGSPGQFHEQCKHLASRGMVAITADYRVASRHQVKALSCVADAKSAVRYIRKEASRLGIDPGRIAAGGGSAGGHIAACTGVIEGFDESTEDKSISSVPNALVLFNPALVLAPADSLKELDAAKMASMKERMGVDPQQLSPYHHVRKGAPPTIIFHGKADSGVPYATAEAFAKAMSAAGNECQLAGYEGQTHGFFNFGRGNNEYYQKTVAAMDEFLVTHGYLPAKSKNAK